jgi:hypothetical protein
MRKEKLYALLSNQPFALPDDSERYGKLYIGIMDNICWDPNTSDMHNIIIRLGNEAVNKIMSDNITQKKRRYHRYRINNKLNRHGYGQINPNPNYMFDFDKYNL